MSFLFDKLVKRGLRRTPWTLTGNASGSGSILVFGAAAGKFTFKWSAEPYSYEYPWGAAQLSVGFTLPVGVTFSPSDAPSIATGVYLLPGTTSDLISTDIVGPFAMVGGAANGGVGTYLSMIFIGTGSKFAASTVAIGLTNPVTLQPALASFKAVVVVWGSQAASPGLEIDYTTGWITSRRVY